MNHFFVKTPSLENLTSVIDAPEPVKSTGPDPRLNICSIQVKNSCKNKHDDKRLKRPISYSLLKAGMVDGRREDFGLIFANLIPVQNFFYFWVSCFIH